MVHSTSCSRDGSLVACGMESGRVSLWHTDGRGQIWTSTERCKGFVKRVDISNDNTLVVAWTAYGTYILLWTASAEKRSVFCVATNMVSNASSLPEALSILHPETGMVVFYCGI